MKKTAFTTVMSILLIIVCLFGLVAVGLGVKDGLAIKKYKEDGAAVRRSVPAVLSELIFVQTRQQNSGNTLCITGIICEAWAGKSRSKPA